MTGDFRLNELEPYLPSSSEKKQAVMMYMVAWLILSMWKREVSPFTHHHIKQSLWWLVFLMLTVFADLALVILWLILVFFLWIAFLITIPVLTIWAMWIYQATKWKYIWENEMTNKFFMLFSGIWNWVLNLFDSNHYQIIDAERYRTEEQFYQTTSKNKKDENSEWEVNQVNNWIVAEQSANIPQSNGDNSASEWKTLDNDQQISINNQDIWIDLSGHEINNPENQINN
jgi:ABC-type transport system involved in Fe-S cluster assembly fused permease/ATPase subunit